MSIEALKKAASSSKVLIFLVFAAACTTALKLGMVEQAWYQETLANAFYALLGGYSLVEAARAVWSDGVTAAKLLEDPKKAKEALKELEKDDDT
jgi:hypothetical protein